jgi:peroxiredoxin
MDPGDTETGEGYPGDRIPHGGSDMRKNPLLLAGVLVLVSATALPLSRCTQSENPAGRGGTSNGFALRAGANAPPFSLRDISGNIVQSSNLLGKPLAINFFATWCPPCREEIPGFVDVYNKYKEQGFELVGISLDTDTRENLPSFVMTYRIGYRILLGDLDTARAYGGVYSLPTTFFIGKDGRIRNVHVGYLDRDAFDREVRNLL